MSLLASFPSQAERDVPARESTVMIPSNERRQVTGNSLARKTPEETIMMMAMTIIIVIASIISGGCHRERHHKAAHGGSRVGA